MSRTAPTPAGTPFDKLPKVEQRSRMVVNHAAEVRQLLSAASDRGDFPFHDLMDAADWLAEWFLPEEVLDALTWARERKFTLDAALWKLSVVHKIPYQGARNPFLDLIPGWDHLSVTDRCHAVEAWSKARMATHEQAPPPAQD